MSKYFIVIFLLINFLGEAQVTPESSSAQDVFFKEQKEIGTPIWNYLNNEFVSIHYLNQSNFTKKIDSLRSIYNNHLKSNIDQLDSATYNDEKIGIKYAFDRYLLNYPLQHEEITGENSVLSKMTQSILTSNQDDFNKPSLLTNKDFVKYIEDFVSNEANKRLKTDGYTKMDNQQLNAVWDVIDSQFTNIETKSFWQQHFLYDHIDNLGIKNIEKFYMEFKDDCTNPEYLNKLQQIYESHKEGRKSHLIEPYKIVDGFELEMHIFLPDSSVYKGNRPTIAYFHGGSWSEGKPDWFFNEAKEYATKGWVATAVEYRIKGRQGTYPFEAVKDAKSAIRWLRANADKYHIDPEKIVVTGNSAGGHLAIATALTEKWTEETDNLAISAVPNVVIVNAAVYDLTVDNCKWIVENKPNKEVVKEISPNHLIEKTATKFLLIHGENDHRCEYSTAEYFYKKMKELGNTIELHKIKDADHFIWYGKNSHEVANITSEYLGGLQFE